MILMRYEASYSKLKDIVHLKVRTHGDARGTFYENYNEKEFQDAVGEKITFVQDNISKSKQNVLRGLHFQTEKPQGKLISVLEGEVWDVVVDLRADSSTFGQYDINTLSSKEPSLLWIPPGFAHGFFVESTSAIFSYKTTDYYHPVGEKTLLWNDKNINIKWPSLSPILSDKDSAGMTLQEILIHLPK